MTHHPASALWLYPARRSLGQFRDAPFAGMERGIMGNLEILKRSVNVYQSREQRGAVELEP